MLHPIRRNNQGKNLGRYLELGERRVIKNPYGTSVMLHEDQQR